MLYGALLIIAPMAGAVVLTWWLGAYALIFGVALVVLAFGLGRGSVRTNTARRREWLPKRPSHNSLERPSGDVDKSASGLKYSDQARTEEAIRSMRKINSDRNINFRASTA